MENLIITSRWRAIWWFVASFSSGYVILDAGMAARAIFRLEHTGYFYGVMSAKFVPDITM